MLFNQQVSKSQTPAIRDFKNKKTMLVNMFVLVGALF